MMEVIDRGLRISDNQYVFELRWRQPGGSLENRVLAIDMKSISLLERQVMFPAFDDLMVSVRLLFGVDWDEDGQLEFVWDCFGRQNASSTPAPRW